MHKPCSYNLLRVTHSQVKNHGIPEAIISNIIRIAREFFRLPESERLKNYSDDPSKTTRLSTSFNVKTENVSNWRDFLRLHCFPLEDYVHEWPSNPPSFRWVKEFQLIISVSYTFLYLENFFQWKRRGPFRGRHGLGGKAHQRK